MIVLETSPSAGRPAWVYKRDGRLVPFEPDKISRALFAATEGLGRPDAFLARELTDGVLHFLASETEAIPTTAQVADTIIKVVRELGQPALAQAFADFAQQRVLGLHPKNREEKPEGQPPSLAVRFSPRDPVTAVVRAALRAYSLQAVFSRDLSAAQEDGLITLTGLETPWQLTATLLEAEAGAPGSVVGAIEQARHRTGQVLVIDGPEYGLAASGFADSPHPVADYTRDLGIALRLSGLSAIVNLNTATAPAWADHLAEGPLFAEHRRVVEPDRRTAGALALLESLLAGGEAERLRVDWHLGEGDFTPAAAGRLLRLARLGVESPALAFVFDRPRKSVALAEGVDRRHPAVLLTVGLHLPRLLQLPGLGVNPDLFLQKLGSLARLALSAAARKREFLRQGSAGGPISRGFLLERARLVVTPVGLEAVVRTLTGGGICTGRAAAELARKMVQRLREVLRQDGPGYHLDACLDGAPGFALEDDRADRVEVMGAASLSAAPSFQGKPPHLAGVAGLTPWDVTAYPKQQLRAAGPLHSTAEAGTVAVVVPGDRPLPPEEVANLLRYAGQQTDLVRLRLVRSAEEQRQLTVPWDEGPR